MARRRKTRRRIRRRTPVKRRRSRRVKKRVTNRLKSSWSKISTGAGALAFLQQVTSKDMQHSAGQPIGTRAQNFINSLSGRITGYNPFPQSSGGNIPQTINLEGIFNKWSGIGLGAWLYGQVPVRQLPHKGKAKTLGKSLLTGGILGGLFDNPRSPSSNLLSQSHSAPIMQNAGVT